MTSHRVLLIEDDPLEATLARRTLLQIDKNIDVVRLRFPIVMFSSSEDQEEIDKAYELGASAFVNKPTAPKAYRGAMEHIVNFWLTINRR